MHGAMAVSFGWVLSMAAAGSVAAEAEHIYPSSCFRCPSVSLVCVCVGSPPRLSAYTSNVSHRSVNAYWYSL